MKHIAYIISAIILIGACKKETGNKIDNSVPLEERLPGTWDVTRVEYTGEIPFGSSMIPFSGEGQNVSGQFTFSTDPNIGEFDIKFVAEVDLGLQQPISYSVDESHWGQWEPIDDDRSIRMWSDTITDPDVPDEYFWEVINNTNNKQILKSDFVFRFPPQYDTVPVTVRATLER